MIWSEQRLGRIAHLRVSNVDKLSRDGEIPVRLCNYVDVYKNEAITGDLDFMHATATRAQIVSFRLSVGDTVFTKDSETADDIGVPAYVTEAGNDLVCGYHLAIATPAPDAVSPRFLFWAMSSGRVRDQWTALAAGVTRVGLRSDDLGKAGIPIPPLDEQRRIADFLDTETGSVDRLIDARSKQLTIVTERAIAQVSALVERAYADFGSIPLRRIATAIEQGWSPVCDDMEADPDEWAVLKTSAVSGGEFDPRAHKRLPPGVLPDRRCIVRDGDLLMTRGSGSARLVGIAAVARVGARHLLISDLLYRVSIDTSFMSDLVAALLRSRPVRDGIDLLLRGQSGQTIKLRSEDVRAIPIPRVPMSRQHPLLNAISASEPAAREFEEAAQRSIERLQERRQALITAAVTGQLDVTTARGGRS